MEQILIEIEDLKKYYPLKGGIVTHTTGYVKAVDGARLIIREGETLGLVGESGCGKSTMGRLIVGLEKPTAGTVRFRGHDLNELKGSKGKKIRTGLQMVFQDAYSSLNPRKHIYEILSQPMLYHGLATKENLRSKLDDLMEMVGLSSRALGKYPHEFSGGQRQRICIAKALSLKPEFVVCDEPVSALDVSIQAQILNLLRQLQKELKLTCLFIGHGLGAVNYVSDRIAVMYLGKIVEIADAGELFHNPIHPYTKALCNAAPIPDPDRPVGSGILLEGEVASGINPPEGCRFHPRCPHAVDDCQHKEPGIDTLVEGSRHLVACPVMLRQTT
ncbi:MAG: ABC transporter ATP-binding protein [Lachnospiraceae bacterium]|nr:ABC transporter ATP-binding protein [Lachnospiraceae bacterium]